MRPTTGSLSAVDACSSSLIESVKSRSLEAGGARSAGWSGRAPLREVSPIEPPIASDVDAPDLKLEGDLAEITERFGVGNQHTPFLSAGVMWRRAVWTRPVIAKLLRAAGGFLPTCSRSRAASRSRSSSRRSSVERWAYLKGPKDIPRIAKNGHEYMYSEGGIAFPDPIDQPSRTILTGEGGVTPSRFKHVIDAGDGRLRRLTPLELERLNGFPDDWTRRRLACPMAAAPS